MPKATALKRGDEPGRPKPRRVEIEFILDRCGTERISICGNFNGSQPGGIRLNGDAGPKSNS